MSARFTEEDAKEKLTSWLKFYGYEVHWEKKNKFGHRIFKSSGNILDKPDLLVNKSNHWIAIEVKKASATKNILDGMYQVMKYSSTKRNSYIVDDTEEVYPKEYVFATEYSPYGRLFYKDDIEVKRSKGKNFAALRGEIPEKEYLNTHILTRTLWRWGKFEQVEHNWDWDVGIGVLISDVLNNKMADMQIIDFPMEGKPLLLVKKDNNQYLFPGDEEDGTL